MSLPKEPRQKMINMMYLVLTALLALNVSAEILNAFKTVNNSLNKTNGVIDEKNKSVREQFAELIKDPQTAKNAAIWKPKADSANMFSKDVYDYIETLKQQVKEAAELKKNEQGEEEYNESNLEAATRIMDKGKKGEELLAKLTKYRDDMLSIVPDQKDKFNKEIPLDLSIPHSQSGNGKEDWTTAYFHMTPSIAAITILSKFQNDIRTSEALISDYCLTQVGKVKVKFDQFAAVAQVDKTYVLSGDEVSVTAGIGAFSAEAKPTILINGQSMPLQADGTALYKTNASGVGDHPIDVTIRYTKPDGTSAEVKKVLKYTVGTPSGASIFLKKMNVVYIGPDNPVSIAGGSVGSEKVSASFSNGTISKVSGDDYVIKATTSGDGTLTVNAGGKEFKFPLRCKFLPDPKVYVGTFKGGAVPAAQFRAMGGLRAALEESDFDAPFQVISYQIYASGGSISSPKLANNNGNRWVGEAANIINACGPGTRVFFDDIRVKGIDGRERALGTISFTLK